MARKRPEEVKSIRALARLVSRGESTVRKWTRDARWPFAPYGPWRLEQVREIKMWAKMYLQHAREQDYHERILGGELGMERQPTKMEQAKLAYIVERAQYIRQKRLADAGELHSLKDCRQRRVRQIHEVKSRLLEWPRSLANTLAMQPAEAVEGLLSEQVLALLDEFSGEKEH